MHLLPLFPPQQEARVPGTVAAAVQLTTNKDSAPGTQPPPSGTVPWTLGAWPLLKGCHAVMCHAGCAEGVTQGREDIAARVSLDAISRCLDANPNFFIAPGRCATSHLMQAPLLGGQPSPTPFCPLRIDALPCVHPRVPSIPARSPRPQVCVVARTNAG